jgi:rare lipoprotein A
MKQKVIVLAGILLFFSPIAAQVRLGNFNQRGGASQEMKTDGLTAAHPSLPLNSRVKVTNTSNGKEVEVTVVNRISASANRIVDLSPSAAQALDLKTGDAIILSIAVPQRSPSEAQPAVKEPTIELERPPAHAIDNPPSKAEVAVEKDAASASARNVGKAD